MRMKCIAGLALATVLAANSAARAEVAIWTGTTNWIAKADADVQAQICVDRLDAAGIPQIWYSDPAEEVDLADWVAGATDDGELDVLILYGYLPPSIYGPGNTEPDGSLLELFIESTDGDAVVNHADWMFYVSSTNNGPAGLQNVMDLPTVTMAGFDNAPMTVTDLGREIAPSLRNFLTDRPIHVDTLGGEWVVEAALAQSADGNLVEPAILRDGDRGRIIPLYQTNVQLDPKGAVAAEVIAWLTGVQLLPTELAISGRGATLTNRPTKLMVSLADGAGVPTPGDRPVTVSLSVDIGLDKGRIDTSADGAFDGSVTSVTIPAFSSSVPIWYRDSADRNVRITAAVDGLGNGTHLLNVFEDLSGDPGEVMIYTGNTGWIAKGAADVQAGICSAKLDILGIANTVVSDPLDEPVIGDWVLEATDNGRVDVLILYGWCPPSIYGPGNLEPDDSIVELFTESTDGDVVMNHADYMFYVSSTNNGEAGIQNIMDVPGFTMWDDNTPMTVTPEGHAISRTLADWVTDRPAHLDELGEDWWPEAILAQNATGTRADPVVLRDRNRGRLIPCYQANAQDDPKGAVAAEIIAWLYGVDQGGPTQVGISGRSVTAPDRVLALQVEIQDQTGSPAAPAVDTTVNLSASSATGRFDVDPAGPFDGSISSVVIAAGSTSTAVYYRDSSAGSSTLSGTAGGLDAANLVINIFAPSFAPAGEVAIYTGNTGWIAKADADAQAQICVDRLESAGIPVSWFSDPGDGTALSEWVEEVTDNGELDVLVLYGYFPDTLYAAGNAMPDGSIAELFIESTDGDAIVNHADYMFYVSSTNNATAGLENMTDVPGLTMWDDDTPVVVTPEGAAIAPSLGNYNTDRPLHLDELGGNWYVEVALAQNAAGTRADPVIARDGDRGRIIPVYQTNSQVDPKGAVAAEIIAWLHGATFQPTAIGLRGSQTSVTGTPTRFRVTLEDGGGVPLASDSDVEVTLSTTSASGAFDTSWAGDFDGTVTSVTIPAGETTAFVYYLDSAEGLVTLRATDGAPLASGQLVVTVLEDLSGEAGEVAIYTGNVGWINKPDADAEAQICVDALDAAGITNTWISDAADDLALADWVAEATDNGRVDVLVLYGYFPPTIYAAGNAEPDGSLAELFIESTDGDVIMNHADYMFYVSSTVNAAAGLQNMMDNPIITMWDDNTPMTVTPEGSAIAPTLVDYVTDRPLHIDELGGEWFVELTFAENASGTRSDPVLVRDGNRGRLIPVQQAAFQNDPKGQVGAEIIIWLLGGETGEGVGPFVRGDCDASGATNITDGIFVLNFLFLGGPTPPCAAACDADASAAINITDGIFILNFLFLGGPAPVEPSAGCARSTRDSDATIGCNAFGACL